MKRIPLIAFLCLSATTRLIAQVYYPDEVKADWKIIRQNKRDSVHVDALLGMAIYYLDKPGKTSTDIDSSLYYAQRVAEVSASFNYYLGEGSGYVRMSNAWNAKGNSDKQKEYLQKALALYEKHKIYKGVADVYMVMGYTWRDRSYVEKAIQVSQKIGNKLTEQYARLLLAELYEMENNYKTSRGERLHALELSQTSGRPYTADNYSKLGYAYSFTSEYREAMKYSLKAVQMAEEQRDTTILVANYYNYLGNTYFVLEMPDKAEECFKKAVSIAQYYLDDLSFYTMLHNATLNMNSRKKTREAFEFFQPYIDKYPPVDDFDKLMVYSTYLSLYRSMNKFDLARSYCDKALELFNKRGEKDYFVLARVSELYLTLKEYDLAEKYIQKNMAISKATNRVRDLGICYYFQFRVDSARQNYLSAIRHYQNYKKLNDSVFSATKIKQLNELQVQYETARKDHNIKLLEQEAALQRVSNESKDRDLKLKEQNILLLQQEGELQRTVALKKDQELILEKQNVDLVTKQHELQLALTKEKEQDIALLTNQTQLQETELQQATLMRNATIGGIIFLVIITGLLFNQYRTKNKSNREIQRKNKSLEILVNEKELLVKEIHHRVKNNLQMVISLLAAQSQYLKQDALEAIQDSKHRVQAMSILHQKLYQVETTASVNMAIYFSELIDYLRDSFALPGSVRIISTIEPLVLDISQAVPLGLILNEALTNSLKYAFPQKDRGEITITLREQEPQQIELIIADNGIGLTTNGINGKEGSLGIKLMKGLSAELDGTLVIESANGTSVKLMFSTVEVSEVV